jgi:hypothetical protein
VFKYGGRGYDKDVQRAAHESNGRLHPRSATPAIMPVENGSDASQRQGGRP